MVEIDLRLTWFATGNNIDLRGDLARRVAPLSLASKDEYPDQRKFKVDDLRGALSRDRVRLVDAALAITRGYLKAGEPLRSERRKSGSFRLWSKMVREPLMWLGERDCLHRQTAYRIQADPQLFAVRELLAVIFDAWGDRKWTAKTLVAAVDENPELAFAGRTMSRTLQARTLALLEELAVVEGALPKVRKLGKVLGRYRDRRLGQHLLVRVLNEDGVPARTNTGKLYRVTLVDEDTQEAPVVIETGTEDTK